MLLPAAARRQRHWHKARTACSVAGHPLMNLMLTVRAALILALEAEAAARRLWLWCPAAVRR